MSSTPLLSVVVVTYQDLPGVRRTLRSLSALRAQAGEEFETVVVDGGTNAEFCRTVQAAYPGVVCVSDPDHGIYDGMNRGLVLSKGRFVWFLNGGDVTTVSNWNFLRTEIMKANTDIIYFGYELAIGDRCIRRSPRRPSFIRFGLPTSHQATVYAGEASRRQQYDLSYSVSADYAFTAEMVANGCTASSSAFSIARFYYGGTSTQFAERIREDVGRVQEEILGLPKLHQLAAAGRLRLARAYRDFLARKPTSLRDV